MNTAHADDARRAVLSAMAGAQWNPSDLATAARLDIGTVTDFLSGRRTPKPVTLAKIESALELESGVLSAIARGLAPTPTPTPTPENVGPDADAVDFVATGGGGTGGDTDADVLAEIRRARREFNEVLDRLERKVTGDPS